MSVSKLTEKRYKKSQHTTKPQRNTLLDTTHTRTHHPRLKLFLIRSKSLLLS